MRRIFNEISAYDLVQYQNQKWVFLADKNAICCIDDKKTSVVSVRDGKERLLQNALYQRSIMVRDKIVFIPFAAKKLMIFDILSKKIKWIDLELPSTMQQFKEVSFKYCGAFSVGDNIYILGYEVPIIIKFNVITEEVYYIQNWLQEIEGLDEKQRVFFRDGCLDENGVAYVPLVSLPYILKIKTITDEVTVIKIPHCKGGYGCISFYNENLYMTGWTDNLNTLLIYNIDSGNCIEKELISGAKFAPFYSSIAIQDELFFFPAFSKKAYSLNLKTGILSEEPILNSLIEDFEWNQAYFIGVTKIDDNTICFQTNKEHTWYEYNPSKNSLLNSKYYINDDDFIKECKNEWILKNSKEIMYESWNDLQMFLDVFA